MYTSLKDFTPKLYLNYILKSTKKGCFCLLTAKKFLCYHLGEINFLWGLKMLVKHDFMWGMLVHLSTNMWYDVGDTGHDAWMKQYSRMVSTPEYYSFCDDIINEVCETFDYPAYFHIGMDEENSALNCIKILQIVQQNVIISTNSNQNTAYR